MQDLNAEENTKARFRRVKTKTPIETPGAQVRVYENS